MICDGVAGCLGDHEFGIVSVGVGEKDLGAFADGGGGREGELRAVIEGTLERYAGSTQGPSDR
jgi:hypothetical protein